MMDVGTYALSIVRQILGREKVLEPVEVSYRGLPPGTDGKAKEPQIDEAIDAKYRTADSVDVHISGDLVTRGNWPSFFPASLTRRLPSFNWPKSSVTFEPVLVDSQNGEGHTPSQHFMQRTLTMRNPLIPTFYHRIDISDQHTLRQGDHITKTWNETTYKTAYNWPEGDKRAAVYKDWWTTYRCQLEEFVNRVKGREGSGVWVDGKESIAQMETIDRTYEKAGLQLRPTSTLEL
jgi:predicted dehydrogenase